jgi:hypothetical protein
MTCARSPAAPSAAGVTLPVSLQKRHSKHARARTEIVAPIAPRSVVFPLSNGLVKRKDVDSVSVSIVTGSVCSAENAEPAPTRRRRGS